MSIIKRYLDHDLFEVCLEDLRKVYLNIRTKSPNINANFWDMQFRKDNNITLYYKSCAFNFELKNNEKANKLTDKGKINYKLKLRVSKSLKTYLIKAVEESKLEDDDRKNIFKNFNEEGIVSIRCSLSDFFEKYKEVFENAVNKSSYGNDNVNLERKAQQYIATILEKDNQLIMLDYEVVVENIDEVCTVKLCKGHGKVKDGGTKNYKETDLLLLKQSSDGKYKFIPVELKMLNSKECGICQVSTYANIIKKHIDSFSENYLKVIEQKVEVGILNDKFKMVKERNIDKGSVDEVFVGVVFNSNISYEDTEKKCIEIRERSLNKEEYLSDKRLKIIPIILSNDKEENIIYVNNFIKQVLV